MSAVCIMAEDFNLNIDSVIDFAVDRNLSLKSDMELLNASKEKINEVSGLKYGSLGVSASYFHLDKKLTTPFRTDPELDLPPAILSALPDVYLGPQEQMHMLLEYGIPLYTSGKLQKSIGAAKSSYKARERIHSSQSDEIALKAIDSYLMCLLTKDIVSVNESALTVVNHHLDQARISYDTGVVAKYDVLRAETAVKEQERKLEEAKNDYKIALIALRTLLNLTESDNISFSDSLFFPNSILDLNTLLQNAKSNNPIISALGHKNKALSLVKGAEQASNYPQVTGVAAAQILTGNINLAEPKWMLGLNVNIPIFDGGVRNSKIAQANFDLKAAEIESVNVENYIELGVNTAYLQLETAKKSLAAAREAVNLSEETLRIANRRFETGNGTGVEVLDANLSLLSSRLAEKAAMYQGEISYFTLRKYCGDIKSIKSQDIERGGYYMKVIGHRGNAAYAPENTLESYRQAIELGVDIVETDLHITSDGIVVVIHDNTLDRTTDGTGDIKNMTLSEIKKYNANYSKRFKDQYKEETVPTLVECLTLFKEKKAKCILEFKDINACKQAKSDMDLVGYPEEDAIIFIWNEDGIKEAAKYFKVAPIYHLSPLDSYKAAGDKSEYMRYMRSIGLRGFSVSFDALFALSQPDRDEFISLASEFSYPIFLWTVDDPQKIKAVRDYCLNDKYSTRFSGVISNDPKTAIDIVRN